MNGKHLAVSSVTCFRILGDGVEINELLHFKGHMSIFGCRFCLTKAVRRTDGDKKGGLYFVDRKMEWRTYESLIHTETREDYVS